MNRVWSALSRRLSFAFAAAESAFAGRPAISSTSRGRAYSVRIGRGGRWGCGARATALQALGSALSLYRSPLLLAVFLPVGAE